MDTVAVARILSVFLVLSAACSGRSERAPEASLGGGGSSSTGKGGSATGPGGSDGTGGSSTPSGGTGVIPIGGTVSQGGIGGGTSPCAEDCGFFGQICDMNSLTCICPGYAPEHCPADALCTDFSDDPDHCGNCETACLATSACTPQGCTAEPIELYSATECGRLVLAIAGSTLYWLDDAASTLSSMDVGGGQVTELASGLDGGSAIALDGTNIYVATGMTLSRVPIAGGAPQLVVTEAQQIFDVAVQAGVLYYPVGYDVKSVPADAIDGTGTVVATAVDLGEPQGVAVDGDRVLWASSVAFNVESDSISGDALVKLGASQGSLLFGAGSLSTDGASVYWVNGSAVMRRSYDGSTEQDNVAYSRQNDVITAFAINATSAVYGSGGNIEQALFGHDPQWMARNQGVITSLVLDDGAVYWSSETCRILTTGL